MTYRVIQWGTGAVGSCSLRQIIDHPELELAGVWVSGPGKAGKDAAEGMEPQPISSDDVEVAVRHLHLIRRQC